MIAHLVFDEKGRQIKKCCRCKQYKVAAEFYRCRSRPDGLNDYCKDCYLEWRAGRREKLTGRIAPKYLKPFKAPRATRRCPHCGYWYAPLRELWHGPICAICASERTTDRVAVTGGGKTPLRPTVNLNDRGPRCHLKVPTRSLAN